MSKDRGGPDRGEKEDRERKARRCSPSAASATVLRSAVQGRAVHCSAVRTYDAYESAVEGVLQCGGGLPVG